MTAISQSPLKAAVGHKCQICYSNYENGENHQSAEYCKKVVDNGRNFFSEITRNKFDWNICDEILPFCQVCWHSFEKIYELNQKKETEETIIDEIVKNLASKILTTRKYLKKTGVFTTRNPSQPSTGHGIKIEGFSIHQNMKCKMCHKTYTVGDPNNSISLDMSERVIEVCEQFLYPELMDEGFFDWNSIPFIHFIPFCMACSQDVKKLLDIGGKVKEIETLISEHVNTFTQGVLKCRKELRKMGKLLSASDSIDAMGSEGSQDTIFTDDDDDCCIIGVSNSTTVAHPCTLVETHSQEPSRPTGHLEPMATNDYEEEFQVADNRELPTNSFYEYDGEAARPNSEGPLVVVSDKLAYIGSIRNAVKNKEGTVPEEKSSQPDSSFSRNENIGPESSLNLRRPSVTVARLSLNCPGTLFKCQMQNCGKMFIYRKSWEAHRAECCPKSFPILQSWDISSAAKKSFAHTEQSLAQSHSKSLPHQVQINAKSKSCARNQKRVNSNSNRKSPVKEDSVLVYNCDLCTKCCKTKQGLKLHMYTHTKAIIYKCRKCGRGFEYLGELKEHHHKEHSETAKKKSLSQLASTPRGIAKQSKSRKA